MSEWRSSRAFAEMGRREISRFNARRGELPTCGAKCRDGHPCKQLAMPGRKRCYLHGGLTPRGDAWHMPVWPDRLSKKAGAKVFAKLERLRRAAIQLEGRIARMSPQERTLYDRWLATHRPGSVARRRQLRAEREQNASARDLFNQLNASRPANSEVAALEHRIQFLRSELAARQLQRDIARAIDEKVGVFG